VQIVYQSFEGRYCDSPRALFEALSQTAHEHVWLADPAHLDGFPPGTTTVTYGSAESIAALESADILIANTHTDLQWDKPESAIYLQTWHGTPLKRIHWDVRWAPDGRLERLSKDVARWDYLISQNPDSTPLLRRAFRFDGPVLESGYPRNDLLLGPAAAAIRARVREELGVPEAATVVLYAPTFRDDAVFAEGGKTPQLALDLDAFAAALGRTHFLLARVHPLMTAAIERVPHSSVLDVSLHPEIGELHLAADVLVTDYSSTMFDFANTGRPIVLHTHDLEDYSDRLRGLYLDLHEIAPGPLLETTEEVIAALADLDGVQRETADRYARFRERFCSLDDGHASARVIDLVPGLAG
jgi:CDP-glycerol glycerophosphotransferase